MTKEKSRPLILRILYGIEDGVLIAVLSAMIFLAVEQVIQRTFFDSTLVWAPAFLKHAVLWVGLLGAMTATRDDNHITVDVISHFLPLRGKATARIFTDLFTSAVCGVLTYAALDVIKIEREGGNAAFAGIPDWVIQTIMPVAFSIISLRYLILAGMHLVQAIKGVPSAEKKGGNA